jgi:hypothetical protein
MPSSIHPLMLSWFSRNTSEPSGSHPDGPEQQTSRSVAPLSTIPEKKPTSTSQDPTHLTVPPLPAGVTSASPGATTPAPDQQQQRQPKSTFTAALNTPHDAVLAELHGRDLSTRMDATPSTSALGMQSIDTLPAAASDALGSVATSSSPPELLYDPFTGVTTGVLSPTSSSSAKKGSEDLWVHLTRIRSLQADVARMHLTMEGIGLSDSAVPHLRDTGPRTAVGERLEDDEHADGDGGAEAEKRRERDFERFERRFDGRKEEIGQIMSKVCPSFPPSDLLFNRCWGCAAAGRSLPSTRGVSYARHANVQLGGGCSSLDGVIHPGATSPRLTSHLFGSVPPRARGDFRQPCEHPRASSNP